MKKMEQQALIAECRASGMTAKAWCETKGIEYRRYVNWVTRLNKDCQRQPSQWVDVTTVKEVQSTSKTGLIAANGQFV